jgi:hypothetical protein
MSKSHACGFSFAGGPTLPPLDDDGPSNEQIAKSLSGDLSLSHYQSMTESERRDFLSCLEARILHAVAPVPRRLTESDAWSPLVIPDWPHLQSCHTLARALIATLPGRELKVWITPAFVRGVVALFHSPDQNEQSAAQALAAALAERLDCTRTPLFAAATSLLENYLASLCPYLCVEPSLRLIVRYFASLSEGWPPAHAAVFRGVLLPLFAADHTVDFYAPLSDACILFYRYDQGFALTALKFLLRHWPVTCSAKKVVFLTHTVVVLTSMRLVGNEHNVERMFACVQEAVGSPNFKVAAAALELCKKIHFLGNFTPVLPYVLPPLVDAIAAQTDHWSDTVRSLVAGAFQPLSELEERLPRLVMDEEGQGARGKWMTVFQSAGAGGAVDGMDDFAERVARLP